MVGKAHATVAVGRVRPNEREPPAMRRTIENYRPVHDLDSRRCKPRVIRVRFEGRKRCQRRAVLHAVIAHRASELVVVLWLERERDRNDQTGTKPGVRGEVVNVHGSPGFEVWFMRRSAGLSF